MLIVCPSCASRYEIDPSKLGTGGRKVRCPSCSFEWLAHGEGTLSASDPALERAASLADNPPAGFDADPPAPAFEAEPMLPNQIARTDAAQEWARAEELDRSPPDLPDAGSPVAAPDSAPAPVARTDTPGDSDADPEPRPVVAAKKSVKSKATKPRRSFPFRFDLMYLISGSVRALFRPSGLTVAGVALLGVMIVERAATVRLVPQTAGLFSMIGLPVNLQGLAFEKISTELIEDTQSRFLIVQGEIRNITKAPVAVPMIEIVVQDAGVKSLYTWTAEPARPVLDGADSMAFRTRLASPPHNGARVTVRFGAERATAKAEPHKAN